MGLFSGSRRASVASAGSRAIDDQVLPVVPPGDVT
jgi:hypothetical protein